ncbi:type IV conjugative transfer system lipoprotein TraV [Paenirhodobacter populi]|uniref:Type IV conjugative transfer system protein TraV n=1 Tax=Paenirhodobacter populi TaxID=2306993 RepID=A0A443JR15_9RHOB|nr:type IV conjugative transfer system lipoprotein TraV [Sinirhodobacter populi]RWR22958.1 type IV conjugative transfer system protein TraV [Sinirhodobacter populi]
MTVQASIGAICALLIALPLAGCGGNTQKDFLCPAQTGGSPCTTISKADRGGAGRTEPVKERFADTLGKEMSQTPLVAATGKGAATAPLTAMGDGGIAYTAAQYRSPEEVGTLWVAPYLDPDGLLHEATFVHFVVREARWASGRP